MSGYIDDDHQRWSSVVVFPEEDHDKFNKFKKGKTKRLGGGRFCGGRCLSILGVNEPYVPYDLNALFFPNVAALAGLRKDNKNIKPGWIRYKDCILLVCRGHGSKMWHCNKSYSKGTAFVGEGSHVPSKKDRHNLSSVPGQTQVFARAVLSFGRDAWNIVARRTPIGKVEIVITYNCLHATI